MAGESDSDDSDLFRQEMKRQGVRIDQPPNRAIHQRKKPAQALGRRRRLHQTTADPFEEHPQPLRTAAAVDQTSPGEPVLFVRAGTNKASLRAFKRAQIPMDEAIDLHGMREQQAREALNQFLDECRYYRWKCVQIIHGKGANSDQPGGVLRPMTIHWLKQQPEVLAFCSADVRDGGTGATNVLLASIS